MPQNSTASEKVIDGLASPVLNLLVLLARFAGLQAALAAWWSITWAGRWAV